MLMNKVLTHEIIIELKKLFCSHLFKNISINDLAKIIGISRSSFYNHFSSKEECLYEVAVYNAEIYLNKMMEAMLVIHSDQSKTIESLVDIQLDFTYGHRLLYANITYALNNTQHPELNKKLFQHELELTCKIEDLFRKAITVYKPNISKEELNEKIGFLITMSAGINVLRAGNVSVNDEKYLTEHFQYPFRKILLDYLLR
jgi:AcrR family transcriptional regulator